MSETNSLKSLEQTVDPTPSANAAAPLTLDAAGHALFEQLGVGGMGEVHRFGDDALQRDLAIKILKAELRGDTSAEQRFLREARLTGSLQHPGIVPVHHLGQLADGRPCYTMKLVRGRTLADLLRHEADGPERLPRLLSVIEKVCQAVAFAHSKGVIHRDLKPSNIMVGEFGEVQVMDWGLAKELSRGEPVATEAAQEDVETAAWTQAGEGLSRAGLALGTPAYMPPEQAAGDWDIVDERADVFALGAILCQILTGLPPYHGANRDDLLRRARRGDLAEALGRLEKCGADAVLVALCRECLAAERLQRPRHAGVVAERLASYQAEVRERLRQAELERARSEVKALEERKRRRLLAVLALATLVLMGSGVAAWWQWHRRRAQAEGTVAVALGEARLLCEQARSDVLTAAGYDKAVAAAHHAVEMARAGGASEAMGRQAEVRLAEVEQEAESAAKDRRLLAALLEVRGPREGPKYSRDDMGTLMELAEPTAEKQFASAFRDWGLDVDTLPVAEAAARLKARPTAVVTEVIAALDEWASQRRVDRKLEWRRVADLAAALDDDPGSLRKELRDILARRQLLVERALGVLSAALRPVPMAVEVPLGEDCRRLRQLAEKVDPSSEPVLGLLALSRALRVAGEEALTERLLRAALTARPREVVLYHMLGQLQITQQPPRWAEAVEFYRAARGLRPDLGVSLANALLHSGRGPEGLALLARMVRESPVNPYLHFQQGYALGNQGMSVDAERAFRQAVALKPDLALAYYNLGVALDNQGKPLEAEASYRKAIALKPDYTLAYYDLGNALNEQGKHVEAEAAYHKAIALKPIYANAYNNLGVALKGQGKPVEAEAACRKAIALKPDDTKAYIILGTALHDQGKPVEAEAAFRKAIALKPDDAEAYNNLGGVLAGQGKSVEAEAAYRKAIALKPDYAEVHCNLGSILQRQGRFTESLAAYQRGHELGSKLSGWRYPSLQWVRKAERLVELEKKLPAILQGEAAPDNAGDAVTIAWMCSLPSKKRYAASARLYADAFAAEPKLPANLQTRYRYDAACSAALAVAGLGEDARLLPDRVAAMFRNWALGWLRDDLTAYAKLAEQNNAAANKAIQQRLALWRGDAALASVRDPEALDRLPDDERAACQSLWRDVEDLATSMAIALKPDDAMASYNLGNALNHQGKFVEAEAAYRKAIALKPDYAEAHCNLGSVLQGQGQFKESLAAYRCGHELGSKQSGWRYPSLQWVRDAERLVVLEKKLPALMSGETKPANVQDLMTVARMATHHHQQFLATVRLLEQSLVANPAWAERLPADPPCYYAACCAAMAAAGKDPGAGSLDASARRRLRQRAVAWLREELSRHSKRLAKSNPEERTAVAAALAYWKVDGWLSAVSDAAALTKLPADEQRACRKLWADMDVLLKRAQEK
ncbi:MAG: tetratricopeptide repeat protein [Gemmataceae bacterium]